MLKLIDITKDYLSGDNTVHALKGVSIEFRKNEFVSILGPSGCGKTTLLNIIGGLDQYTSGDLCINSKSTKDFSDRDWDTYRNHSIGFVFQSYNLIPHQSVLQNVELALSLSGVSKNLRREKAVKALEKVGLGDQLNKKPSQLSGGQMQRVAIARAIVNDPEIILADEPTGALDSETSVQVMDILKEISNDRLVIMVTHNGELAEKYSTRIIKLLDGNLIHDSKPLTAKELKAKDKQEKPQDENKKGKKPSLSFATSFGLSLKNLISKKARTALTSFAGSIGIIGIALIFAVSQGMTNFIDTVQEDTLSSYPLTLEATYMDMGTLLETFIGKAQSAQQHENDAVYQKTLFYDLVNSLNTAESTENDLRAFKEYLETQKAKQDEDNPLSEALSGVQYTYNTDLLVYTENVDGTIIRSDTSELLQDLLIEYFGMDLSAMFGMGESYGMTSQSMMSMSPMGSSAILWQEMLSGNDGQLINPLLEKQYDVIYGSWPTQYNEIVLVVDKNNEIDDMTLYALGLKSKEDIDAVAKAALNKTEVHLDAKNWTYKEICDMEFKVILGSDCYTLDEKTGKYTDLRETTAGLKYLYDNAEALKVSGIIRPSEDAVASMLTGSIGYTHELTEYIIEKAENSDAVKAQAENEAIDIFSGLPFKESTGNLTNEQKVEEFKTYVNKLDVNTKAETYIKMMSIPSEEEINLTIENTLMYVNRSDIEKNLVTVLSAQMGMSETQVADYLAAMTDEEITDMYTEMVVKHMKDEYAQGVKKQFANLSADSVAAMLDAAIPTYTTEQIVKFYDEALEFSSSTYKSNLAQLGFVDLKEPSSINLYASTFENKDVIEQAIKDYNESVDDLKQINYTDYVGLMMSSITTIINAITYVLIAFVAVSLIVSSIMIGVITLISVQERTKEIGILRAIGASKANVSSMFNAETVIIGFASGALGVLITYLLCIPLNAILHALTGISNLSAHLPVPVAITLVVISVILTLFSGIIPSRSAAKKDPVVALRTE
ncbi:MAG: ABC transporter ATP-binding protein/permease [Clostridia bacterium]|nr:ABC transporter ATP-binding protein/permease [Clostridia bacterium]